jgi:hypothetical protein
MGLAQKTLENFAIVYCIWQEVFSGNKKRSQECS